MSKKKSVTPQVRIKEDASLRRVGIIAFVGFALGIVWPRLAGVSLVPEAPVKSAAVPAKEEEKSGGSSPSAEDELIELSPEDRLGIGSPKITSCLNSEGKKSSKCDSLDMDAIIHPSLMSLLGCPAATGVFGMLSLGFKVNFETGKVSSPKSGRSTNLPKSTTDELLLCAKKEFQALKLPDLPHQFTEYQVYYSLEFKTPQIAAAEKNSVTPASGSAVVQWGTAIVRKEGSREASIQTRLMSGARVVVTGRNGAWYRVKYDAKGREGWVIGKALGLD